MTGWAKLPRCLTDALARGEIDFRDLALIAFFVVAIDWRTNEYVGDRTVIAHQSRWDLTEDYLSKKLRRLRKAGWLEFESEPGKRDAYVIRLGPKVRDPGRTSDSEAPSQSEVTSDRSGVRDGAISQEMSDSEVYRPRPEGASQEVKEDRRSTPTPTSLEGPARARGGAGASGDQDIRTIEPQVVAVLRAHGARYDPRSPSYHRRHQIEDEASLVSSGMRRSTESPRGNAVRAHTEGGTQ